MEEDTDEDERPFWERKTLGEMNREEWESLCDGCGQCCRLKVCDSDTGEVTYTPFACKLLDLHSCRCSDYPNRRKKVPTCLQLTPKNVTELDWLPPTCAYRRLADGQGLPEWHPLKTHDPDSVHKAGISVRGQLVSESSMKMLADDWGDWMSWQDELSREALPRHGAPEFTPIAPPRSRETRVRRRRDRR